MSSKLAAEIEPISLTQSLHHAHSLATADEPKQSIQIVHARAISDPKAFEETIVRLHSKPQGFPTTQTT